MGGDHSKSAYAAIAICGGELASTSGSTNKSKYGEHKGLQKLPSRWVPSPPSVEPLALPPPAHQSLPFGCPQQQARPAACQLLPGPWLCSPGLLAQAPCGPACHHSTEQGGVGVSTTPRLNKAQAATQSVLLTVPLAGSPCTGGHCLIMKKVLIFA